MRMNGYVSAWHVVVVLVVLLGVCVALPASAEMKLVLKAKDYQPLNGRTTYYYDLFVSSPTDLKALETTLTMRGMSGVLAQGNANYWKNSGVTPSSAKWSYMQQAPFTLYGTFDIIADAEDTEPGPVSYTVDGPTGQTGTVEGPVPKAAPPAFEISGTVYLDNDRSGGLYDGGDDDETLSDVLVELLDSAGNIIATTTSNTEMLGPDGVYVGNYLFGGLTSGDYSVRVPASVTGLNGELLPTTVIEQSVTIVDAPVRQIDFGYAPEPLYTVSGTTFMDWSNDGAWDQSVEEPLAGVGLIQLVASDGSVVAETTSGPDPIYGSGGEYLGNYVFADVPAGSYSVVAPGTAGNLGELDITGPSEKTVDVVDANVTGIDFGYLKLGSEEPANVEVMACVFFDFNRNGQKDDFELPFDGITVELTGAGGQVEVTADTGLADFGSQGHGDYSMEVTDGGAYRLLDYWVTTTQASYDFTIDADTDSPVVKYFGYYPDVSKITQSFNTGDITGDNHTIGFWKHNVVRAIAGKKNGTQVSREELLQHLADVEGFGPCDDPYQFGDEPLDKALWYLDPAMSGNSPVAKLERQLLAAELNWVSGRTSSTPDLEWAIYWYAEWVANADQDNADCLVWFIDLWNNLGE